MAEQYCGRFLNYLLVPVYTMAMSAQSGGYGVVTNVYAWVALMLVLLTCGMETGFFRFANKGEDDPMRVYSTTLLSVSVGALTFLALGLLFLNPIAGWLEYGDHPWYVGMMMIVVAMDAIQSIPFAYLRYKKRPIKFAALKLLFIFLNIALNLLYYVGMKGDDVGYASFQSDMYLYHHALHDSGVAWVFLRAGQKTAEADACLLSAVAGTRLGRYPESGGG